MRDRPPISPDFARVLLTIPLHFPIPANNPPSAAKPSIPVHEQFLEKHFSTDYPRLCQSDYEFGQHARIAQSIGITEAELLAITRGPTDPSWSPFERALLQGVDELHSQALVADATWAALSKQYNVQQMIDYVFTVGQYNLVSMALNSLGVEREEGVAGFPENANR